MAQPSNIDFIIIGAQKAGTTAAAHNLDKHPKISVFNSITEYGQYEIEFFNQHWERGPEWYFQQLPHTDGIKGEKTAELLHRTICHKRIFDTQPMVKLIVLLRNPIHRAYSQWRMAFFHKKDETRSFEEVIFAEYRQIDTQEYKDRFYEAESLEISCWREGYIIKGFYCDQLMNLFSYFPSDQVHIAISEQIIRNKSIEYNKMFSFLNVSEFDTEFEEKFIGKTADKMNENCSNILKEIYSRENDKLFNFLGYEINEWQ